MRLVYIVGAPATGKSTLMAELTRGCEKMQLSRPIAYQLLVNPKSGDALAIELGRSRENFPGTDTLSMSVAPRAKRFLASRADRVDRLILAEGDRLGFPGFLEEAQTIGYAVTLIYLEATPAALAVRAAERGSAQNVTWAKGRATKALKVAQWADGHNCQVIRQVSSEHSVGVLADDLRGRVPDLMRLPYDV